MFDLVEVKKDNRTIMFIREHGKPNPTDPRRLDSGWKFSRSHVVTIDIVNLILEEKPREEPCRVTDSPHD